MRMRQGAPGGDLFGGDEALADPPVERAPADPEEPLGSVMVTTTTSSPVVRHRAVRAADRRGCRGGRSVTTRARVKAARWPCGAFVWPGSPPRSPDRCSARRVFAPGRWCLRR